jgi:hypothetical protein
VPDPYDDGSPVHEWGPLALSPALFSARLGAPFGTIRLVRDRSQRVTSLEVGGVTLSGLQVMRLLHLRSTWFSVGALSLTDASSSVVFGRRVGLAASVQGVTDALLQKLTPVGWVTLRRVRTMGRVAVRPSAYTIYRLTAGRVRGPEVGISVAPEVRARLVSSEQLAGQVLPRPSGAVTVSRYVAGGWRVVARPHLDAHGVFHTPLRLRPGGYRIDVAGDAKLAPASRKVRVTSRILASLHK